MLTREGRLVALALDPDHPVRGLAALAAGRVGPGRVRAFSNDPDRAALARLAGLVDAGAVRPVVDGVFPMAQVADVHRRLEAGGVRGKYVVDVREDPTPHAGR